MDSELNANLVCMGCMRTRDSSVGACPSCGFDEGKYAPAPHHLSPRTILAGKYLIGRALGEGGFGITYLGWDLNLELKIAIKEFYPTGFVTRESTTTNTVTPYIGEKEQFFSNGRGKFVEEAKSLAKFYALPGIVSVKDFFQENGTAYIVMEYVEGETLKQRLEHNGGKLPAAQVLEMMKPLMRSLSEIHRAGIIHRDISPDNIMVTPEGNVKLLDFGSARDFAGSGNKSLSVMLKPGYAPEEQYRSRGVQGPWTDVYALCATIYRAITGVIPDEAAERIREDGVKPPSQLGVPMDSRQETALMKGMAVLQKDRFQSVDELCAKLYEQNRDVAPAVPYMLQPASMPLPQQYGPNAPLGFTAANAQVHPPRKNYFLLGAITIAAAGMALVIVLNGNGHSAAGATLPTESAQHSGVSPTGQNGFLPSKSSAATDTAAFASPQPTADNRHTAPLVLATPSTEAPQPGELAKVNRWSICCGNEHVVVQFPDGSLLALGSDKDHQCDVSGWTNILQLQGGYAQTIGLRSDGTVVGTVMPGGDTNQYGQCDVSGWTDIVQIESGWVHTVGLKSDGTVVAAGYNKYGQCNTGSWRNIAEVAAGAWNTAALTKDGHVYSIGDNAYGELNTPWEGITQIAVGRQFVAGLEADGTVVASGRNGEKQCAVSNFKNVVEIASGDYHLVGLRQDGTVVATPMPTGDNNNYGQCNVSGWKDIIAIFAGARCTIGMKRDGSLVYTGINADTYQRLSDIRCIVYNP